MAQYGRRRRSLNLGRALVWFLAVIGGLALLMTLVNLQSLSGLIRLNLAAASVRDFNAVVRFREEKLAGGKAGEGQQAIRLEKALRQMGLPATVRPGI